MIDASMLKSWALELGFSEAALCSAQEFRCERQIVAQQQPLKERMQLRFDPAADFPQTKSLAVLLWAYEPAAAPSDQQVFVDSYYYASNAAYHAARALQDRLVLDGHFAKANVSYPAKAAAMRAGLGIIGQNGLLITEKYGSRVVIILMATDIELEPAGCGTQESVCLKCGRCFKACPSGALDESGMRHPQRCLRNYMMEGVVVPEDVREQIGMRLIGCDVCQRVCPMQPEITNTKVSQAFTLSEFMTEDESQFSSAVAQLAQQIGKNAARPQRVRAQAALLAGNSMNPEYLPVLRRWADSPFDAVRKHAEWAILKIEQAQKSACRP